MDHTAWAHFPAILDIETNLAHDHIWFATVLHVQDTQVEVCYNVGELRDALRNSSGIVGHNLYGFDLRVLRDVWGFDYEAEGLEVRDTLVMSRLLDPTADGGHSLRVCAQRAGQELKDGFDPALFDQGITPEMVKYGKQDCRANRDVYLWLCEQLADFSHDSIHLEHEVARLTAQQVQNGFRFDSARAMQTWRLHDIRMGEIEAELQATFPPIVEERYHKTHKDEDGNPKRLKDKVTVFNVGSRQQIAERLAEKGAVWKSLTATGKPKVDDTTLAQNSHVPEAAMVLEYLTLSKRRAMLRSWLDAVEEDNRIRGYVNPCGAVTGRMTHSKPNMAQIPSDPAYRSCFTVEAGNSLVGVDASGLELRMLAHYMQDAEYIDLILNGDVHTANQESFGCDTRDQAKTLIYALIYGAGDPKLGSVLGGRESGWAKVGAELKRNFRARWPAYDRLESKLKRSYLPKGWVPGLDGRRIAVRHEHAILNTLLQGGGAVVMKKAAELADAALQGADIAHRLVAQVHDEFQHEVAADRAEDLGVIVRDSIRNAGTSLNLRIPLDGEYKVGQTWAATH